MEHRAKDGMPVLAICYDFDKTLTPEDMQAQGYIQSVGYDVAAFWKEVDDEARAQGMDGNLAYMHKMIREAEGNFVFTRKALEDYGARVALYDGVETWFERIRRFGAENGVAVEHYIISSGIKEMIEGTRIAREGAFTRIYANAFCYNERGVAVWPAQVVNYTVIQIKLLTLRGDYFVLRLQPFILPFERIPERVEVVWVLDYLLHKRVGDVDAVGAQGRQHLVEHPSLEALG